MGCGCGGKKSNAGANIAPTTSTNRLTVYQVIKDTTVLKEFDNLREARAEAVAVGGRVKVTSKSKVN